MNPFELEAIKNCPKEGPVYMVNLLKYREKSLDGDGSGRDAYMRYGSIVSEKLPTLGAVVIWMGSVDHLALAVHEGEHLVQIGQALLDLAINHTQKAQRNVELDHEGVNQHDVADGHSAFCHAHRGAPHHQRDADGDDEGLAHVQP